MKNVFFYSKSQNKSSHENLKKVLSTILFHEKGTLTGNPCFTYVLSFIYSVLSQVIYSMGTKKRRFLLSQIM